MGGGREGECGVGCWKKRVWGSIWFFGGRLRVGVERGVGERGVELKRDEVYKLVSAVVLFLEIRR